MFEITIEYTPDELKEMQRLNKVQAVPKWQSVAVAVLSVLPSVCLLLLTKSFIIVASAIALAFFLAWWIVKIFLDGNKLPDEPPVTMVFSDAGKKETQRNTVFDFKWHMFEETFESEDAFFLRRLDGHTLIPKRSVPAEHLETFKGYLEKVGGPAPADSQPVELYSELASANPTDVIEFHYEANDLLKIGSTWNEISGKPQEPEMEKAKSSWAGFAILLVVSAVLTLVFLTREPGPNSLDTFQFVLIALAVVLPFLILYVIFKIVSARDRAKSKSETPKIPVERNRSVLLKNGWIVGARDNISLYDWRDVDKIFDNKTCYGLKLASNQIIIIPKRIFANETVAKQFANKAVDLHREHRRSFETPVAAVETGNPYQAPLA